MNLRQRVESREAKVGVIGLGYVGLPLTIESAKAGFSVTRFDIDSQKVKSLEEGESNIKHISCPRTPVQ